MGIDRRQFVKASLALPAAGLPVALSSGAMAQASYPAKEIRVVCNYPAGSGADIIVRWYAGKMAELAKQTVIVDNKVGAAGNIGTEFAARAKPDGYTLLFTPGFTTLAGATHLFKSLPFNPAKDFVPIAAFAAAPFILVTDAKRGYKTLADLTAALKAKPKGRASYGTVTNTATASSEMYGAGIGVELLKVAYKSPQEAHNDLFQGQIDFAITDAGSALEDIRSGKASGLAWTTETRPPSLPNVPTFQELGFKDVNFLAWWAAFAPTGTPQPAVDAVAGWIDKIVAMPETKKFLDTLGVIEVTGDAKKVAAMLEKSTKDWELFVRVGKIEKQ